MAHEQNTQGRQETLDRLFQLHYSEIRDLASQDPRLLVNDIDNVVEALQAHITSYEGQLDDEPFLAWASSIIRPAINRISKLYQILEEHRGAIRGGIRSALHSSNPFDDNNALVDEISQEVALLIMFHLDSLTEPSRAKLSVRLYGLARRHALDYYVKKARGRLKAVQRRLAQGGRIDCPEVLSDLELAAMAVEKWEEVAS